MSFFPPGAMPQVVTTDATPAILFSITVFEGQSNMLIVEVHAFSDQNEGGAWRIGGAYGRVPGVLSPTALAAPKIDVWKGVGTSSWDASLVIFEDQVQVQVTGVVGRTIRWTGIIQGTQTE